MGNLKSISLLDEIGEIGSTRRQVDELTRKRFLELSKKCPYHIKTKSYYLRCTTLKKGKICHIMNCPYV